MSERADHRVAAASSPTIAVLPAERRERYAELLDQLERALGVRFAAGLTPDAVAILEFREGAGALDDDGRVPRLVAMEQLGSGGGTSEVAFAQTAAVPAAFAGRLFSHRRREPLVGVGEGFEVLAELDRKPAWVKAGRLEVIGVAAVDTHPGRNLRARLATDDFLFMLAVVHWIRRHAASEWQLPPLRAAFLFDDPNLHTTRYGYLDFSKVAAAASQLGYHVSCATIPLDTWFASRKAVDLFRNWSGQLSLLVHGNNHLHRELGRPDARQQLQLVAQALSRVERFERRHGLKIERMMAPPHGACSEETARALLESEFEGLCVSRPYPWLSAPPSDRPLAGWTPTAIVAGGLPVLPRVPFGASEAELALRAFLHQPLVLYGHHGDLSADPDLLAEKAHLVRALGVTEWASPGKILRRSYQTSAMGDLLQIQPNARRLEVHVPESITRLSVQPDALFGEVAVFADGKGPESDGMFSVTAGSVVNVELRRHVSQRRVVPPPRTVSVRAYIRRGLTETRDRLEPKALALRR